MGDVAPYDYEPRNWSLLTISFYLGRSSFVPLSCHSCGPQPPACVQFSIQYFSPVPNPPRLPIAARSTKEANPPLNAVPYRKLGFFAPTKWAMHEQAWGPRRPCIA